MTARVLCGLIASVAGCAQTPGRPDTVYRVKPGGAIDLGENPDARHCSERTRDFRDAYGLEASVKTVLSVAVAPDEASMQLRTDAGTVRSSRVIGDSARLRAFWYYGDWTLAVLLDHGSCEDGACPGQIFLIRYNGARDPIERPTKLCFEKWVGTFKRVPHDPRGRTQR